MYVRFVSKSSNVCLALYQVRTCSPPLPLLKTGANFMKDALSAESNEKSYIRFFRFLDFELWLIVFTIYGDAPGVPPTKIKSCSKVVKFT